MNMDFDNAQDDRDALEKHASERGTDLLTGETAEKFDPVTGEVFDEDAPVGSGWDSERHCATDLRGADWAGRKLREAHEQLRLHETMFLAEQAEFERKRTAVLERFRASVSPFLKTAAFMENALKVFAETHREEVLKGLRTKSRLLPSGVTVGWRKTRAKHEVTNLDELWDWAGDMGVIDEVFPEPPPKTKADLLSKRGLNAVLTRFKTPPGVTTTPAVDELFVSTGVETKEES